MSKLLGFLLCFGLLISFVACKLSERVGESIVPMLTEETPTEVSTLTALTTADENWEILQVGYSPVNMYVIQNLPALPGRMPELFPIDKGFPVLDQYNIEADLIGYGITKDELFIRMTPPYGEENTVISEVFVDGSLVWPGQTYTWLDPTTEETIAKLWVSGSSGNGGLHLVLAVKR